MRSLQLVRMMVFLSAFLFASAAPTAQAQEKIKLPSSMETPIMAIIDQFAADDVPTTGPAEIYAPPRRSAPVTTMTLENLPGGGLARHPMVYIGEGDNTIYIVKDGKIIWTYQTGTGWELDDVWLMTNGNVLFTRQQYIAEVTRTKEVVWRYDAPGKAEIHACQPIGLDKVMFVQNDEPPKLMIYNKKTKEMELVRELPAKMPYSVHAQFRRARVTPEGTYLIPFLQMAKVIEYDKDFNEIWSYDVKSPWAAVRLHNGNTLITNESDRLTLEVNPKGETVWSYSLKTDLPPHIVMPGSQSCARLANGNTIICSRGGNGTGAQLIEVTPDKEVVWVLYDWENLGPATAVQILNDPGIPENPGDLQR